MAQGTFTLFNESAKSKGDGRVNMATDSFKVAFVTLQAGGTPTVAATDAVPTWGAGGTTNLSSSEVAAGGGYTAGGKAVATPTWTLSGAVTTFDDDGSNLLWTSAGSGDPATIKVAILYSDTATNKDCIGFMDMTTDGTTAISLLAADVGINWNASGILAETANA
jgi:hypothetical protein